MLVKKTFFATAHGCVPFGGIDARQPWTMPRSHGCRHRPAARAVVRSLAGEDGQVAVAVKDVAVGIAPQTADRLLQSFYTTKQDGMGFSICRSIVEGMEDECGSRTMTVRT